MRSIMKYWMKTVQYAIERQSNHKSILYLNIRLGNYQLCCFFEKQSYSKQSILSQLNFPNQPNMHLLNQLPSYQILLQMKKNQSSLEASISAYYFAVHPLTLYFTHNYDSNFKLYFEKGLQIISKNQLPSSNPRKEQLISFSAPPTVPYFRIQAQKNLEYEWSLYGCQQQGEQHEQFMEGAKVSLRPAWQRWTQNKINVWEGQQEFNVIKCKLTFLTVIARTPTELQQAFQQHLALLSHPIEISAEPVQQTKNITKMMDVEPQVNKEEGSAKQISTLKLETVRQDSGGVSFPHLNHGDLKESKILNQYPTHEAEAPESPSKAELSLDRHKLSLSDIQVADSVAKDVENYETSKLIEKVETIAEVPESNQMNEPPEVLQAPLAEPIVKVEEQQQITMTQSQLLNEHHEVIASPKLVLNKKYILIAVILLLALSALAFFSLKRKSASVKSPKYAKKFKSLQEKEVKKDNKKQEKFKQEKKESKGKQEKHKVESKKGRASN